MEELGPTIDELVEAARVAGRPEATRRTIRHWVSKGLVSTPSRAGREWLYPVRSSGEVDTVARWRKRGVSLDQTRFAVFIEIGSGAPEAALALTQEFVASSEHALAAASASFRGNPEILRDEATKAARMRGRAPLPHRVRGVSLAERTLALILVMSEMFSVPLDADTTVAGMYQLERILGLRSGRGGSERDLTAITIQPSDLAHDPTALLRALSLATRERVELARRGVEFAVVWMPALRATLVAEFGVSSAPLVDMVAEWEEKLTPDVYALMFATFIRNGLERATDEQITETLPGFTPPLMAAAMLADRPPHERDLATRRLRPYQRMQLEQVPQFPDVDAL